MVLFLRGQLRHAHVVCNVLLDKLLDDAEDLIISLVVSAEVQSHCASFAIVEYVVYSLALSTCM